MPFVIAVLGILAAAYFWANRMRDAGNMVGDLADMAGDVKAAARRFGFSRRHNEHPVESIDDPNIAAATIAQAFVQLDHQPTQEMLSRMNIQLRSVLRVDAQTSEELQVLGAWLVNECQGPQPAITRTGRKLFKMEGSQALKPLTEILNGIVGGDVKSDRQTEALQELAVIFRER